MRTLTTEEGELLFVEVPEDAHYCEVFNRKLKYCALNIRMIRGSFFEELPEGYDTILCELKLNDMTPLLLATLLVRDPIPLYKKIAKEINTLKEGYKFIALLKTN